MRLGIIGSGKIVTEFLPKLVKLEGLEVVGIKGTPHSLDQVRELCGRYEIPCATDDFEELCAAGIDTVYVAVPNFLHFATCKQALEKGLNVIVEKPIASTVEEAELLQQMAREKNCFLFEAITTVYYESYQKIREWLPRIGRIRMVQSQYSQYSSRYDAFREGKVLPAFDPAKSGGALMDLNLYNLHFVLGLFGEPTDAQYFANIERGIDTSGMLLLQYPDFVALCAAAKDSEGASGGIIQGTEGVIRTDAPASQIGTVTLQLRDGTVESFNDGCGKDRLIPEFRAFIRAVNEKDHEFCERAMQESVLVSAVQTKARRAAGIVFAADEKK